MFGDTPNRFTVQTWTWRYGRQEIDEQLYDGPSDDEALQVLRSVTGKVATLARWVGSTLHSETGNAGLFSP